MGQIKSNEGVASEKEANINQIQLGDIKAEDKISYSNLAGLKAVKPVNSKLKSASSKLSTSVQQHAVKFGQIASILSETDQEAGANFNAK